MKEKRKRGKIIIYDYEKRLSNALERVKSKKTVSENNRQKILDFYEFLRSENLGIGRLTTLLNHISKIAEMLQKDFELATEEDLRKVVADLQSKNYSPLYIGQFKISIKQFWKWLKKTGDEYPPEVKWLKTGLRNHKLKLPEDMYSEQEVLQLINKGAVISRDKCIIAMLYETGCRIGELGNIKIKHIKLVDGEGFVQLSGKTGDRTNFIKFSLPYLKRWLAEHPFKDPENALFINIKTNNGQALNYEGYRYILETAFKNANIGKPFNPHHFRHSRASYLSGYLTESQLCQHFGWTQGSPMTRIYVHMNPNQLNDAMRRLYGLGEKKKLEESKLQPKKCEVCGEINAVGMEVCIKCNNPLTLKKALEKKDNSKQIQRESKALEEVIYGLAEQINELRKENREIKEIIQGLPKERLEKVVAIARGKE